MNEGSVIDAQNMLETLLKSQPGLIKEIFPSKENGVFLADFLAGFIRQYSEHLDAIHKGQSRQ